MDTSFPYKKLFITKDEILKRFDNLSKYEGNFKEVKYNIYNIPSFQWYDKLYYPEMIPKVLIHADDNYHTLDEISDYFIEDVRIKARRFDNNLNMEEFWEQNKNALTLKHNNDLYSMREELSDLFKEVGTFRPTNIVAMIKFLKATKVLDFSSGWGDRLIGALACNIESYTGVDPNKDLQKGYQNMIDIFCKDTKVNMICSKIEDAELEPNSVDLIFTSPPYFDLEIYNNSEDQSHNYGSEWYNKFLLVALKKVWNALEINGHMIIIINDKPTKSDNKRPNINEEWYQNVYKSSYVQKMIRDVNMFSDSKYHGIIPYAQEKGSNLRSPQPMFIWKKEPLVFKLELKDNCLYDFIPDIRSRAFLAFANNRECIFYSDKDPLFVALVAKLNGKTSYYTGKIDKYSLKALMYGIKPISFIKNRDALEVSWSSLLNKFIIDNLKNYNKDLRLTDLNANSFIFGFFEKVFGVNYGNTRYINK